jgi:hypothetical protein
MSAELPIAEWAYGVWSTTLIGAATQQAGPILTSQGWRPTKIKFFAAAAGGFVGGLFAQGDVSGEIPVLPGGCVELSPDGHLGLHDNIAFSGAGSVVIVEFLYRVNPSGTAPTIVLS